MKNFLFNLMLLTALVFGSAFAHAAPPDDCLQKIGEALDNGNTAAFESLIDVDAILEQALNAFLAEAQKPDNATKLPPMLGMIMAQGASTQGGQAIRNLLLQEARAFITNGVASGSFAGRQLGSAKSHGVLAPLFSQASPGRKEIRGLGEPLAVEDGWIMPFSVHDYGNGNDYPVIGKFLSTPSGARLVSIENLDQLFQQIQKEMSEQ